MRTHTYDDIAGLCFQASWPVERNVLACCSEHRGSRILSLAFVLPLLILVSPPGLADNTIWVPVRWCGIEGAPSMANPSVVNETSTDDVLWRRHERPTDAIYLPMVDMTFRAGSTAAIKNGPLSFPIIRDPLGSGGNILSTSEASDAVRVGRRAWLMGDPLYFDANNNGVVNNGVDTMLSIDTPIVGLVELGHDGAPLVALPGDVKFVDSNLNGQYNIGERLYRDENLNGSVDGGDTLLGPGTLGTVVGDIEPADLGAALVAVGNRVRYVDLIRRPANTYNIGYPAIQGITAISANDFELPSLGFHVHGIAAEGISGNAALMDDPSQYLPPGPNFRPFEIQLVAHEFGHAFGLQHGDGFDDDSDGLLDDGDDPSAPIPDAGPGTLCDAGNVMQYCWRDTGAAGVPNMQWIGVGVPGPGIFTAAQSDLMRNHVLTRIPDRVVDPVTPPLVSARTDAVGDVAPPYEYLDITDFSVTVDTGRTNAVFMLKTRRPVPVGVGLLQFFFILDVDGNQFSGGAPEIIVDPAIPTDFKGAEYVIALKLQNSQVREALLFEYSTNQGSFVPVLEGGHMGMCRTIEAVVDYPGERPDSAELRVCDEIKAVVPIGLLTRPFASRFTVEFISVLPGTNVVDRARTRGMNFDVPVFPICTVEPKVVGPGEQATITASGLLTNHHLHVFLGDEEVSSGLSDSNGVATIQFNVPVGTMMGKRLVTVGALAVTADCFITVVPLIKITNFVLGPNTNEVTITWESRVNGPFYLEASTNLMNFETVASQVSSPLRLTLPSMEKRFLRVRASQ